MKNIFGINRFLYADGENSHFDGEIFVSKTVAEKEEADGPDLRGIAVIPKLLWGLKMSCMVGALVVIATMVFLRMDLKGAWENAPHIPLLAIIFGAIFLTIQIIEMCKRRAIIKELGIEQKPVFSDDEEIHEFDEEEEAKAAEKIKAELGIPEDALDMDVLVFIYKEGEDGIALSAKRFDFMTAEMFVYADEEHLHVSDYDQVFSIPRSKISALDEVKKEVACLGWSKEEPFDSEAFAPYGLTENKEGFTVSPSYYSLKIDGDGEEFELCLPVYEGKRMKALLEI